MEMKRLAVTIYLVFTLCAPAYEVFDLMTGSSPSASRAKDWRPGDGLPIEVGGMAWIGPDRLAVANLGSGP